jgi:hypothetical protein
MPPSFRPLRGPERGLQVGDRFFVLISSKPGGLPLVPPLKIVRVVPDREITWRGGLPGVALGEHSFYFEDAEGGATRVRSEETWSGVLIGIARFAKLVEAAAVRVGHEQIAALARSVEPSRG